MHACMSCMPLNLYLTICLNFADKCEHANPIWMMTFDGKKSKTPGCTGDKEGAC